jgi:signal peptidase I
VTRPIRSWRRQAAEFAVLIAGAVVIALLVQAFAVKPFRIPTPTMADTVHAGDRVLVDRISYHFADVGRGDVIVFTGHGPIPLLKRVVGVPGDTIALRDGRLYVNGHLAAQDFVRRAGSAFEPTLPGPDPSAPCSLHEPFVVPAGQYFVMGDNRTDSDDSRYWGMVLRAQILGKAFAVYWPPGHLRGL